MGAILVITASTSLAACTDSESDSGQTALCSDSQTGDPGAVANGVAYVSCELNGSRAHILTVDLEADGVGVGVLMPDHLAATERPSTMGEEAEAVAVVNGDFFNNREDGHPDEPHTDAPVGPVVVDGEDLKGPVPGEQRMGPRRYGQFTANDTVFGITTGGRARVSSLHVDGEIRTPIGSFELDAVNQYAIPDGGIGAFTPEWGPETRNRAVCGTDDDRHGPCSEKVTEVTVVDGVVSAVNDLYSDWSGVDPDETVFVARDSAADDLLELEVGDPVTWEYELVSPDGYEFTDALGGLPLIVDDEVVYDFSENDQQAPRTVVANSQDGLTVYMVVVDGRTDENPGVTLEQITALVQLLGVQGAVALDGGGSSLMAAARPDGDGLEVVSDPSDPWVLGEERPVANALAVFGDPSSVADDRNPPDSETAGPSAPAGPLEGTWNVVATSPGQASTLVFDAEGNATYTSEGTIVDYWSGSVETEDGSVFTVDFTPSDSIYEEYGEDADPDDWAFTMTFELGPDGDTLVVSGEFGETEYVRAED